MAERLYKKIRLPIMFIVLGFTAEISYLSAEQNVKKVYEEKCSRCHSLKNPDKYEKKEWKRNVKRMSQRAGLTEEEINSIIDLNKK